MKRTLWRSGNTLGDPVKKKLSAFTFDDVEDSDKPCPLGRGILEHPKVPNKLWLSNRGKTQGLCDNDDVNSKNTGEVKSASQVCLSTVIRRASILMNNKKAQLKIQEMAFVLVAFMLFFALVGLMFVVFRAQLLERGAADIGDERARIAARTLAASPELSWGGCSGCIDSDKAFVLAEELRVNKSKAAAFDVEYLALEVVYPPRSGGVCTRANYPQCNQSMVLKKREEYGIASATFVSLCSWGQQRAQETCALGKIVVAGRRGT